MLPVREARGAGEELCREKRGGKGGRGGARDVAQGEKGRKGAGKEGGGPGGKLSRERRAGNVQGGPGDGPRCTKKGVKRYGRSTFWTALHTGEVKRGAPLSRRRGWRPAEPGDGAIRRRAGGRSDATTRRHRQSRQRSAAFPLKGGCRVATRGWKGGHSHIRKKDAGFPASLRSGSGA